MLPVIVLSNVFGSCLEDNGAGGLRPQPCNAGGSFLPPPSSMQIYGREASRAPTFVLLAGVIHSEPRYCSERRGSEFSGAWGSMAKSKISPSANPGLAGRGMRAYSPG